MQIGHDTIIKTRVRLTDWTAGEVATLRLLE